MENLAIIFGGDSAEHEISVITALQIISGYTKEEFNVLPIFLSKNGEWFLAKREGLCGHDFAQTPLSPHKFKKVFLRLGQNLLFFASGRKRKPIKIDVCINCCHGGLGENGNLVAILSECNIPVSSQGALGLGATYDKVFSKLVLKGANIETLDCVKIYKDEWETAPTKIISTLEKMRYPLIVKPARQGSSIGVSVAKTPTDLVKAIKLALEFDTKVLVEKALTNFIEFNCSALGAVGLEPIMVSKVDCPKRIHEILSFEDKYVSGQKKRGKGIKSFSLAGQQREFLKGGLEKKIQDTTIKVMEAFELSGVIRVDYLYDIKRKKLYVNEVNSVPGSLAFYFWIKEGLEINDLVEKLIKIAKYNYQKRFVLNKDFHTSIL
ncbi:MAG: hypothetical protein IJS68_00870 [Clostridia bacterium]|nr:hypothetical protein [Clostridia bacterium]